MGEEWGVGSDGTAPSKPRWGVGSEELLHGLGRHGFQGPLVSPSTPHPPPWCRWFHHPPLPTGFYPRVALPPRPTRSSVMPKPELLETFPNPYPGRGYEIAMECPEFTSLCPMGGIESDAAELKQLE